MKTCKLVYTQEEAALISKFQGITAKLKVGPNGCIQLLFVEGGKEKEETICTGDYILNLDYNKKYAVAKIPAEGHINDESSGSMIQLVKSGVSSFKYTFKIGTEVIAPPDGLEDFPKESPTNWQAEMPALIVRLTNTLTRLESFLEASKF